MRAAHLRDDAIQVVDVPEDVEIVPIRSASICGSDFDCIEMKCQAILGHELAGTAADGRAVTVEGVFGCRSSEQCAAGTYNMCPTALTSALRMMRDSGMAYALAVPERHQLPKSRRIGSSGVARKLRRTG